MNETNYYSNAYPNISSFDSSYKILYKIITPNGWSIIIMPDNILIDNYHVGKAHIHPDPNNHAYRVELSLKDCEKIYEMIKDYLNVSNDFDIEELMEMLK